MQVIKKNGNQEEWNDEKIVKAILKSADHSSLEITKNQATQVAEYCKKQIQGNVVETSKLHGIVIDALRMLGYSEIANSYRNYRNFKETDYETWREMYEQAEHIIYRGDNENANFDSSLISTKGSLIKGNATKRIYQDFILNKNEKFLTRRGDIYIHDMRDMIFGSVNCFDRNTKFITTDGLKSFNDFNDGDTVTVLTAKGNWKSATVHCYGKQALNKVGIKRSRSQETYVYVTKNHRWILKDNCETTELKVGDVLCDTPKITAFEWNDLSNENKTYWCLGFLFGDGTQAHSTACSIRLCGDKSKYANRFEECGFTVTVPNNKGWNGDSMVWMHDTSKSIPPIKHMTVENIKLFINGLLCADGGKDLRSSQREFRSLQVSGEYCDDIYNMLHIAGYYVNSVTDLTEQETNYAVRRKCTKQFKIYENAVERTSWRISSIEPTNTVKDVWCLNVEDDHSFILEHGIPTGNCCLFDIANVLKNGFTMSNIKYSEPNSVLSALQVIGDITLVATAQQFGGFTLPEIDKVLLPYVKKSFNKYMDMYTHRKISKLDAEKYATEDTLKELQQGFQGLELKLNTVPCSRGDFAFTTLTFGQWDVNLAENDKYWLKEISRTILDTRRIGHNGVSVVFPKLVYLYDENQINNDHYSSELFDIAVKTSAKCMYPDYLSLSGDIEHNKVAQEYSEHGTIISPMGCRAYLSHWEDPTTHKAVTVGRCNIGAVSLNIPVIMAVAKQEYGSEWKSKFWALLESRLQTIREFLCKRYELISHVKASTNPLAFTQGGFYNGYRKPDEEVGNLIDYMTASFGITALNESTILWNGKTLYEDKAQFANKVIDFIDDKVQKFKKEDHHLYALYGTPAESLCGKQAKQYAELTGDTQFGEYFTNSFHCHVSEDITPVEKQNAEYVAFHKVAGGHIQYVRIDNPENFEALKAIVVRGMHKGFYQGVNFDASHCNDCGYDYLNGTNKCPKCGSTNVTTISRVCGYLGYSNINGHSRMNDAKMAEVRDRKSM